MSPGKWLLSQRIEHARRLLEGTDLPIDGVARRAGFGFPYLLDDIQENARAYRAMCTPNAFGFGETDGSWTAC